MTHENLDCDLAIVGGGLAGGLAAIAVARARPEVRLRLIEPGTIGGNHVWSFFDADLDAAGRDLIGPAVGWRWPAYDVAFPKRRRTIAEGYNSVPSEAFAAHVDASLPADAIVHVAAESVTPTSVTLKDGRTIRAGGVIDARGVRDASMLEGGWQKFVGRELRLARPHGLTRPVVMDATVAQLDGYRFVYLLPFGPDRVFVEETYYSNGPELDPQVVTARIEDYARGRGWDVLGTERHESGVLAVVSGGSFAALWGDDGVAKIGVRSGLFHPTTGYSLPDAAATAGFVAGLAGLPGPVLYDALKARAAAAWRRRAPYRLLDKMLFAAEPDERYRIFEYFYGKGEGVLSRFYAGRSTLPDFARILTGRPPMSVRTALKALLR